MTTKVYTAVCGQRDGVVEVSADATNCPICGHPLTAPPVEAHDPPAAPTDAPATPATATTPATLAGSPIVSTEGTAAAAPAGGEHCTDPAIDPTPAQTLFGVAEIPLTSRLAAILVEMGFAQDDADHAAQEAFDEGQRRKADAPPAPEQPTPA